MQERTKRNRCKGGIKTHYINVDSRQKSHLTNYYYSLYSILWWLLSSMAFRFYVRLFSKNKTRAQKQFQKGYPKNVCNCCPRVWVLNVQMWIRTATVNATVNVNVNGFEMIINDNSAVLWFAKWAVNVQLAECDRIWGQLLAVRIRQLLAVDFIILIVQDHMTLFSSQCALKINGGIRYAY